MLNVQRPRFDFEWRALEGSTEIGRGSGRSGANGSGIGWLMFGDFPAEGGHVHTIEVSRGPDFDQLIAASPSLEVGVNTATVSIGLEWSRVFTPWLELFSAPSPRFSSAGALSPPDG